MSFLRYEKIYRCDKLEGRLNVQSKLPTDHIGFDTMSQQ